jgi:hypothetical protein
LEADGIDLEGDRFDLELSKRDLREGKSILGGDQSKFRPDLVAF